MKIKNIVAILVIAFVSATFMQAQTVTVNNVPKEGLSVPFVTWRIYSGIFRIPQITWRTVNPALIDGQQNRISWSHPSIPANDLNTMTEVVLVKVNSDGTEQDLGLISFGTDNPAGGRLDWMTRKINGAEQYKIKVVWKDFFGTELASATSYKFNTIIYGGDRALVMTEPMNTSPSFTRGQWDSWWVRWNSQGTTALPADARVAVLIKSYETSEIVHMVETSNTGAVLIRGGSLPPGNYFAEVVYALPQGIIAVTSNAAIVVIVE